MSCPVCDGTDRTVVNVRMEQDSDLKQVVGSTWDGRNVARCDECGVLYDHRLVEDAGAATDEGSGGATGRVNCPGCGSLNAADATSCSHCGAELD